MTTAPYILLITLFLTEGGTLEAEETSKATTYQACVQEAKVQEQALRKEFAETKAERGLCPFQNVKIRCKKLKASR